MTSTAPLTIRLTRTAAGLSQRQAANLIGVHVNSWHRWEAGITKCPSDQFARFCDLAHVRPVSAK